MALSSSSNVFRRVLKGSSSSLLQLQQKWRPSLLQQALFTSTPIDNCDDTTNCPPLTTPKLFISGLSRLTTDENLKAAFSRFGQLLEAKVVTDRVTGRSKGFAFIRYATIDEAKKAREEKNATYLDGWVIFVDPAKPREPRPRPPTEQGQSETGFRINKTVGWCG